MRRNSPRVLFVTHVFPPEALIGARRCKRVAVALRDRGWQVDVLTVRGLYSERPDPGMLEGLDDISITRTHALNPRRWLHRLRTGSTGLQMWAAPDRATAGTSTATQDRSGVSARLKNVMASALRTIEIPDSRAGWLIPALVAAVSRPQPDVILTSTPWYTNVVVAALIARMLDAPLVIDYRDPWTDATRAAALSARRFRLEAELEDWCLGIASRLVATTPTIARQLNARSGAEVDVVFNASDPDDFVGVQPRKFARPTLFYAGSLYGGRQIDSLLDAMLLEPDGPALHYMGESDAQVLRAARERGLGARVTAQGPRPHGEAMAAMLGARANVCIVAPEHHAQIPGKLFEQLGCGRSTLLIGPKGCDAAAMIAGLPDARYADITSPHDIAAAIARLPDGRRPIGAKPGLSVAETMDAFEASLRKGLVGHWA